jgi:uncharacterized membrane protein YebE (DUF533 family)
MSQVKHVMSDSKFNMWRACVAAISLDGNIATQEKIWITKKAKEVAFSNEQISILEEDLKNPVDIKEIIPLITDKKDLAFLLHQVRVIGNIDGHYDDAEKSAFKEIEKVVMSGLDLDSIQSEIELLEKESYHEDKLYKTTNHHSVFEALHKNLLKFFNPGDYKFPKE